MTEWCCAVCFCMCCPVLRSSTWAVKTSSDITEHEQIGGVTWARGPTGRGCRWFNEAGHYKAVPEDSCRRFWGGGVTPPRPVPCRTSPQVPVAKARGKERGELKKFSVAGVAFKESLMVTRVTESQYFNSLWASEGIRPVGCFGSSVFRSCGLLF